MIVEKFNRDTTEPFLSTANTELRPLPCVKEIQRAFDALDSIEWGLSNGLDEYRIGHLDEKRLVCNIIKNSPDQKNFYVLDIGCGKGDWGRALMKFIDLIDFGREDFKVHIINVRGEKQEHSELMRVEKLGPCILYLVDKFKVEDLVSELQRISPDIQDVEFTHENNFDLIVSHLCFRHLVDPVGTFIEAYKALRQQTGVFLTDGFHFQTNDDTDHEAKNMYTLLSDLGAKYIGFNTNSISSKYIIKKEAIPSEPSIGYTSSIIKVNNGVSKVQYFKKMSCNEEIPSELPRGRFGNQEIYEEFFNRQSLKYSSKVRKEFLEQHKKNYTKPTNPQEEGSSFSRNTDCTLL